MVSRQRGFLLAVIAVIGGLSVAMLLPFAGYILAAVILGFVLYPAQHRFTQLLPDTAAAALVMALTVFLAVLPVLVTVGFVADDAASLAQSLEQQNIGVLQDVEQQLMETFGQDFDIRERVKSAVREAAGYVAGSASQIVQLAANVGIGLSLMLFVQFYVLRDGKRFVAWSREFDVMPDDIQDRLYDRTAETTHAVIKGHVLVAILQGIIAGIGLFLVGIPNAFFWTFLMVLLGFIPIIGTALVWAPAGLYLLATGNVNSGIFLLAYGTVVVGMTDNFARPLLVDEGAGVHEVYILLGVVGGTLLFGAIGIFIGPILFGVFNDLLTVYKNNYDQL